MDNYGLAHFGQERDWPQVSGTLSCLGSSSWSGLSRAKQRTIALVHISYSTHGETKTLRGKVNFPSLHDDVDTNMRITTPISCGSRFFPACCSEPSLWRMWNVDIYKWKSPWASSQPDPHSGPTKSWERDPHTTHHLVVINDCHWFWSETSPPSSLYNLVYIPKGKVTFAVYSSFLYCFKTSIIFNTN